MTARSTKTVETRKSTAARAVRSSNAEFFIGPSHAARILDISRQHVLRLVEAGKLPAIHTEIGRLILRDDVEALAAARASEPKARRAS